MPIYTDFFFTSLDPRAAVKGSRDPLGLQPIWSHFGRKVIGNLTTVTGSLRNFTTLILGLYLADVLIASGEFAEDQRVNLFLKFEQLAAYSRCAAEKRERENSESPRGLRRVVRNLNENQSVTISALPKHQILSDQKTYGIFGLFTVAARQSGLVELRDATLTSLGKEFVEREYVPRISKSSSIAGSEVIKFLRRDMQFSPYGKHKQLREDLAGILGSKVTVTERAFYLKTLITCDEGPGFTNGCQAELWGLIQDVNNEGLFHWGSEFSFPEMAEISKRAVRQDMQTLAHVLRSIQKLEPLLAASASLFGYLLTRGGSSLERIAREVRKEWGQRLGHIDIKGIEAQMSEIQTAGRNRDLTQGIGSLASSLFEGDYATAARAAMDLNAAVLKARGGNPWVSLEGGRISVRLKEESGSLIPREKLPRPWSNTYFINSLKSLGHTINRGSH
jgi:hypothetical protein